MEIIAKGNWMGKLAIDMLGIPFQLGDLYVKATTSGRATNLEITTVTKLINGRVYGGGSKIPVMYPERCLIINEKKAGQNE